LKSSADTADVIVPFKLAGQTMSLAIFTDADALTGIDFLFGKTAGQRVLAPRTAIADNAAQQLLAYLDDPQRPFDLPLDLSGTDFQRRLWSALQDVPVGDTATYGQLVKRLGMKGGAQAVGQACRRNPVPIVVPCHRILSQSGMGGYAGETGGEKLRFKQALLKHEGFTGG
jgi:methylated-DNA-[protein]-cysteine S-methyltransferase